MSFSDDVRGELAAIAPARDCDRLAELSALFHFAGRLHLLGRGEVSLHLDLASSAVARRAFALLRSFEVSSEIRTYRRHAFGQETRYQLHVEGGSRALKVLERAGVVDARHVPRERTPKRVVSRAPVFHFSVSAVAICCTSSGSNGFFRISRRSLCPSFAII